MNLHEHKSETIGFHEGVRGPVGSQYIKGWWIYRDGTEGGELLVDAVTLELMDYDGAFDLPHYIKTELAGLGVMLDDDE